MTTEPPTCTDPTCWWPTHRDDWRVLTVHQPWAWAIRPGGKTVENRGPTALGWTKSVGAAVIIRTGRAWSSRGCYHPTLAGSIHRRYGEDCATNLPPGHPERPLVADYPDHRWAVWHVPPYNHRPPPPFAWNACLSVCRLEGVHSAMSPDCDCDPRWAEHSYQRTDGTVVDDATHLVLGDIIVLDHPVPDTANGRLGLTRPTQELVDAIRAAL